MTLSNRIRAYALGRVGTENYTEAALLEFAKQVEQLEQMNELLCKPHKAMKPFRVRFDGHQGIDVIASQFAVQQGRLGTTYRLYDPAGRIVAQCFDAVIVEELAPELAKEVGL